MSRCLQEAPFSSLVYALSEQDVEVRAAIVTLINYMVTGIEETQHRILLRKELEAVRFSEICSESMTVVRKDLDELLASMHTGNITTTAAAMSTLASGG